MAVRSRAILVGSCAMHAVFVFVGTALLGFVVAPTLAIASGRFPIESDARAAFAWLTLKGVPYLVAGAALSGLLYPRLRGARVWVRTVMLAAEVLVVWLVGAGIALLILG